MCDTEKIYKEIQNSIDVKQKILQDQGLIEEIAAVADGIVETLRKGGKILLCGNGGSASDALHIAGELLGRFQKERKAYAVVALNADIATITAVANDYGYNQVFARQIEGLMTEQDMLIGISTSGNSENIFQAFIQAGRAGGKTVLMSGKDGGKIKEIADFCIIVPSDVTAHIQEAHECIYHILCGLVEDSLL